MENNNGNGNPSNSNNSHQDLENLDATALRELIAKERADYSKTKDDNRKLFARAKAAEGFEQDADGNWVKVITKTEKKKPDAKAKTSDDEFDETELMYLEAAHKISSKEDIDWVRQEHEKHGGTLRELFGNKYFQGELKTRQENAAAAAATPKGDRGGTPPNDTVDYHLAKYLSSGTLPDDQSMREKVINERIKREDTTSQPFSNARPAGVPPGM